MAASFFRFPARAYCMLSAMRTRSAIPITPGSPQYTSSRASPSFVKYKVLVQPSSCQVRSPLFS